MMPEEFKTSEVTEEEFDSFLETTLNNSISLYKSAIKRLIKTHAKQTGTFEFNTQVKIRSDISMSNSCDDSTLIHNIEIDASRDRYGR